MFHERLTHSLHCSEFVELTLNIISSFTDQGPITQMNIQFFIFQTSQGCSLDRSLTKLYPSFLPMLIKTCLERERDIFYVSILKTLHFTNVFIFCIKSNTNPPFIALLFLSYYGTSFLSYTVV